MKLKNSTSDSWICPDTLLREKIDKTIDWIKTKLRIPKWAGPPTLF